MIWNDNGWPVVGNKGRIGLEMEGDLPAALTDSEPYVDFIDNFDNNTLNLEWNFIWNPKRENYSLTDRKGYLKITAGEETLNDSEPAFLGIR